MLTQNADVLHVNTNKSKDERAWQRLTLLIYTVETVSPMVPLKTLSKMATYTEVSEVLIVV